MPRVIQVIEHYDTRGKGTREDPVRRVVQYLDFAGNVLAEQHDEYAVPAPIVVTTDYRSSPCS